MRAKWITLGVVACFLMATVSALAGPYVTQGPFVAPLRGPGVPHPWQVAGKEYSHWRDWDQNAAADPHQVLAWDGAGGIADSFDYTGSFVDPIGQPISDPGDEVDALANQRDVLFYEVIADKAALLVSARTWDGTKWIDPLAGDGVYAPVRYEPTGGPPPKPLPVWATWAEVDQHGVPGQDNLDGLEVWGPTSPLELPGDRVNDPITGGLDGPLNDDSNRFSLEGDPMGVSVWVYDGVASSPWYTQAQIGSAIGLDSSLWNQLDLDALMSDGSSLLFSIAPIGPYDGGEIWAWDGTNPAGFLFHGGHLWDTANDVTALLGAEDVDALEAVAIPEAGSLALFGLGLVGLLACGRRRRK